MTKNYYVGHFSAGFYVVRHSGIKYAEGLWTHIGVARMCAGVYGSHTFSSMLLTR